MTPAEIRAMRDGGDSAWEVLQAVIDTGVEFPDAVWKVSQALRLDREQVEQMKRDYDECI